MAKLKDDLEAVRLVANALEGFNPDEQERIIRWAREKLGLVPTSSNLAGTRSQIPAAAAPSPAESAEPSRPPAAAKDVKSFVTAKSPKSDIQFAATVAYFYRFEASPEHRKDEIDATILQDASRLAGRARFQRPLMTLNNAKTQGLLDSGSEAGKFVINTVGENLVAMTLPSQSGSKSKKTKPKKSKNPAKSGTKKKK
jgi:hypothetical protein